MAKSGFKSFVDFLAFVAVVLIGVVLAAGKLLSLGGLYTLAQALAYIVVAVCAYVYAKQKRSVAFLVAYWVSVILIAIFFVWPIVG